MNEKLKNILLRKFLTDLQLIYAELRFSQSRTGRRQKDQEKEYL